MQFFVAIILMAAATNAGTLRHRIASDLPSRDDIAAALAQMKDMKLSELANVLRNSEAVKNSYRRAAMDVQEHGLSEAMKRLTSNPKVGEVIRKFAKEGNNLYVRDLTNLRQKTSPDLQSSVRSALDSMMADEGSRPLATHLKQAWDAESVDEQLKHLSMALDALDSSDNVNQADAADAGAATDDSETAEDARADGDFDAEADEDEEIADEIADEDAEDEDNLDQADDEDDEDDDDDESFEFEDEEDEDE